MRTFLYISASAAVLLAAVHVEAASNFKATVPTACKPSLEAWVKTHGRKTDQGPVQIGAPILITWDNGKRAEVLLHPTTDPATGQPAVCVVMSRSLGAAE